MFTLLSLLTGKLDEAIEHLTEAIILNPSSAILYATRGTSYLQLIKLIQVRGIFVILHCYYCNLTNKSYVSFGYTYLQLVFMSNYKNQMLRSEMLMWLYRSVYTLFRV